MKNSKTLQRVGLAVLAHVAFLAVWQFSVMVFEIEPFLLPTPIAALETLAEPNYMG